MKSGLRRVPAALALAAALFAAAPGRAQTVPAASISATAIGVSSITVTWIGDPGTTYQVVTSTDFPLTSTQTAQTFYSATVMGYSTNTLVSFMVEASSPTGSGIVDSSTNTIYTLAAPPNGSALLSTIGNQSTLSWDGSGNPLGTTYNVEWFVAASTPVVLSTVSVAVGSTTATIFDLPGGQAVDINVQAVNFGGVATTFDITLTTTTAALPNQPTISSGTVALSSTSIQWSWSASTGAINYQLFADSGVAVSPLLGPNQLTFTQTGLSPNTQYADYVEAFGLSSSTNSAGFARFTLAAPTTGLTLLSLSSATETLSWGANGNPPNTVYIAEWWTTLTSTVSVSTQATTALVSNLSGGATIFFTIQARNGENILSGFDATLAGPSVVYSTSFPVGFLNIPLGFQGVIPFVLPNAAVNVFVSSGSFPAAANLTITELSCPSSCPPSAPPGLSPIASSPIAFKAAAVDSGGAPLKPTNALLMSVFFVPSSLGAVPASSLAIAEFDPLRGWVTLATSRSGDSLSATTNTFEDFAVFGVAPPSDLSEITVGPNPLRPILNPGQPMTFRNLPPNTRVRIFTYVGEKLADLNADGSGTAAWDGRNASGSFVASGVYIAVIQGAGIKKTMRVAIER
jgi:hypothetical protein